MDTETEASAEITEQPQPTSENGTGRKRVDVATLDPNEKVVISVQVPAGLKLAVRKAAEAQEDSETQFVRNLIARELGYEIPESFNERKSRTGAYAGMTAEEKEEAQKAEQARKRDAVTNLLATVHENPEAAAILATLGLSLDDLPKPRAKKSA
jgi:hypothetical protein